MLKRPLPTSETIQGRQSRLATLRLTQPSPSHRIHGLEIGNSKTGSSGSKAATILLWNLPAVATCPGASEWCLSHCYNGDDRPTVYRTPLWQGNWYDYLNRRPELHSLILEQIRAAAPPVAVRIHSSGDFFSSDYIKFWFDICSPLSSTMFWAYTRSWTIPELKPHLEKLRELNNVQLFASHDATMPVPPDGWRVSKVCTQDEAAGLALLCPEQSGSAQNCASCGYCFRNINNRFKDVIFYEH